MVTSNVKLTQMFWILLFLWSASGVAATDYENIWLARGITHECRIATSEKTTFNLSKALKCAIYTRYYGATEFDYNYQICDIYGGFNKTSLMAIEYRRVKSLERLEEIASGKTSYSSGSQSSYVNLKEEANNGDEDTYFNSPGMVGPFWLVDLGEVRIVHRVRIHPNVNGCKHCKIWLGMNLQTTGDFSSYTLFAHYENTVHDPGNLTCYSLGVAGRYLAIQRSPPDPSQITYLVIKEVKVYASEKP